MMEREPAWENYLIVAFLQLHANLNLCKLDFFLNLSISRVSWQLPGLGKNDVNEKY